MDTFLKTKIINWTSFAAIIILLFSVTTVRISVWKDGVSLWQNVLKNSPRKARGYNELGWFIKKMEIAIKPLKCSGTPCN